MNHRFKQQYRAALDELPLDAVMAEHVIREANIAFLLNMVTLLA
jgi:heme oxygenase